MTLTFTALDDRYQANEVNTGKKRIVGVVSLTNPYSTGGERIGANTYFPKLFMGGNITMINPSVSIDLAGVAATGQFRADTASIASTTALTPLLQFFNAGLSATTKAGLFVDNTVANLSGTTVHVEMFGN